MPPKPIQPQSQPRAKWQTHKLTAKKPLLPLPERIKKLFTSLCAQIDGGHFNGALKSCDKILRLDPTDPDALQTKLFLLLQTEQYTAALTLIDEHTHAKAKDRSRATNGHEYAYERAYSLYRLQRESDARDVIEELKKLNVGAEEDEVVDRRGVVHLEAQLSYREGAYDTAFDLYNHLLDTAESSSEEHADILTNLQASQKHLDFINSGYLHALDALSPSVSSTLETTPAPIATIGSSAATRTENTKEKVKTKKPPRASRIPAGVVPGVTPPPDPERWVKKSERTAYLQGRKRRGGGGGGATQGVVGGSTGGEIVVQGAGGSQGGKGKKRK